MEKSGGLAAADEFVDYYTSPGVQHCFGGTGADTVDLAEPMFEWLEIGTKPSTSQIIATHRRCCGCNAGCPPALPVPQYPRYVGGDTNAAASFFCTTP